ncbi:TetR/AcrR family transcriptional regulator [Streptomyces sp. NBC_01433]|uniref:TetR/AcrR family transcriptional regulator n=1 Tax=Streptomyces sp. NBC_01433 TaxID=2903864 RepID=UPI002257692D|nr:TetR/AcrR family transcriptional regulator [Streptomyces sp. NBC_01433]MCX4680301.1 TetR/AcrR family transcriptional regulator [Streptomyces sp. NBC_01433]
MRTDKGAEARTPGRPGRTKAGRGLRSDAARNEERLKAAAAEVFRERGLGAPVDEIAKRAGVSVGTLYHRFGGRERLIEAVVPEALAARLEEAGHWALEQQDAWEGFTGYIERLCDIQANDRSFGEALSGGALSPPRLAAVCAAQADTARRIVANAHQQGTLREDFTPDDLSYVFWFTTATLNATADSDPHAWRRGITFLLDGLRARSPG